MLKSKLFLGYVRKMHAKFSSGIFITYIRGTEKAILVKKSHGKKIFRQIKNLNLMYYQ
jgi:hypothetical protein